MHVCMHVCMQIWMYVCKCVRMCACLHACECVCVCMYARVHACMHASVGQQSILEKRVQTSKIVVPESGSKQADRKGDISLYPNGRGTRKYHLQGWPVWFHFWDRSRYVWITFLEQVNRTEMPRINPHVHASDDDWNAHTHTARSVGMVGAIFHCIRRIVNLS